MGPLLLTLPATASLPGSSTAPSAATSDKHLSAAASFASLLESFVLTTTQTNPHYQPESDLQSAASAPNETNQADPSKTELHWDDLLSTAAAFDAAAFEYTRPQGQPDAFESETDEDAAASGLPLWAPAIVASLSNPPTTEEAGLSNGGSRLSAVDWLSTVASFRSESGPAFVNQQATNSGSNAADAAPNSPIAPGVMASGAYSNSIETRTSPTDAGSGPTAQPLWSRAPGDESIQTSQSLSLSHAAILARSIDNLPDREGMGAANNSTASAPVTSMLAESARASSQSIAQPTKSNQVGVPQQIADGIITHAQVVERNGQTEFHIRLDPPELGSIEIRLRMADDGVTAHVAVADHAVRHLIEEQLPALRQRLSEAGVELGGFQLDSGAGSRQEEGEQRWTRPNEGEVHLPAATTFGRTSQLRASTSVVDVTA